MKKLWNFITTLFVAAAVVLAVALAGVRLAGIQVYTVLSGSVIYVKKVDYTALRVGDPITFMVDEHTVATHRIVDIIPDDEDPTVLRFVTKGDAPAAAVSAAWGSYVSVNAGGALTVLD